MSFKNYIDKNEKYIEASNTKVIDAKIIELIMFGLISFAFGFVGGKLPVVDGITFGICYVFLIFLFILFIILIWLPSFSLGIRMNYTMIYLW